MLAESSPICFYIIIDLYSYLVTSHFCQEYGWELCQFRLTCHAGRSNQRRWASWHLNIASVVVCTIFSVCVSVLLTHFSYPVWWHGNQFFNPEFDMALRQTPPLSTCHPAVLPIWSNLCYFNPVKLAKCLQQQLRIMINPLRDYMLCVFWLVAVVLPEFRSVCTGTEYMTHFPTCV